MIGSVELCAGLYLLKIKDPTERQLHDAVCVSSESQSFKSSLSNFNFNKESHHVMALVVRSSKLCVS